MVSILEKHIDDIPMAEYYKYLAGELSTLPELEVGRLRLDEVLDDSSPKIDFRMIWRNYADVATANPITY